MKVILFRHGPAADRNPDRWPADSKRPLTPSGVDRTRRAALGLCRVEGAPDAILSSSFERAIATARILAEVADNDDVKVLAALEPGGSVPDINTYLNAMARARTVVLVGHEPDLGALAANWIGCSTAITLKKAGACVLDFAGAVRAGAGELEGLYRPRALRRLAGRKEKA